MFHNRFKNPSFSSDAQMKNSDLGPSEELIHQNVLGSVSYCRRRDKIQKKNSEMPQPEVRKHNNYHMRDLEIRCLNKKNIYKISKVDSSNIHVQVILHV